jgi:hypothetical protein
VIFETFLRNFRESPKGEVRRIRRGFEPCPMEDGHSRGLGPSSPPSAFSRENA